VIALRVAIVVQSGDAVQPIRDGGDRDDRDGYAASWKSDLRIGGSTHSGREHFIHHREHASGGCFVEPSEALHQS
jgi:hypothetical protein